MTKPNTFTVTPHSFVDLITNSSTEIYISANAKTVEFVKNLINNLLVLGGSKNITADDIFEITLDDNEDGKPTLKVTPIGECAESVEAAKILNDLTGLFSIDAEYNG